MTTKSEVVATIFQYRQFVEAGVAPVDERDELAALNHSITSSASESTSGGMENSDE